MSATPSFCEYVVSPHLLCSLGLTYDEGKEAQDLLDKKLKKLNRIESMKLAQDAAGKIC